MVEKARKPLQDLFTMAASAQFITREKGHYAYFYARPSKRLASALSLDREVLILFTSFYEQQQRTVKLAKELIDERGGRLESTVAIIIHNDKEGNGKLPKWGREHGLAILPVFVEELPPTSEQLERYLCHELFSHDPFDVTGPVSDDVISTAGETKPKTLLENSNSGRFDPV